MRAERWLGGTTVGGVIGTWYLLPFTEVVLQEVQREEIKRILDNVQRVEMSI